MEPDRRRLKLVATMQSTRVVQLAANGVRPVSWRLGEVCPLADASVSEASVDLKQELLSPAVLSHIALELRRVLQIGARVDLYGFVNTEFFDFANVAFRVMGFTHDESEATHGALCYRWKGWLSAQQPPLVSILISSWNPRYFRQALHSALAQTYAHIEIVVCDDHRGDTIKKYLELMIGSTAAHRFPIRYVWNDTQLGVRANYVKCLQLARGEYIKYLNDDDTLEPHCVERMVDAFSCRDDLTLVTSHRRRIDERGHPLNDQPATLPVVNADCVVAGHTLGSALLLLGLNFVGEPSTVLFRRSAAVALGEPTFDFLGEPGRGVTDIVLWAKLLAAGNAVFLKERLSCFRIHAEQGQANPLVTAKALTAIPALRQKWTSLGLHERVPPNYLLTQPLRPQRQSESTPAKELLAAAPPWQLTPVPLFTPEGAHADTALTQWRAKQHPFFAA
jgi:hypothetical protein